MVLTWSMTIAAFVIIFVELGTWSSETIHASVGLATTILCFIQPFMAAMRPHPGAPRRALFNWVHWFVGNVAKICARKLSIQIIRMSHIFFFTAFDIIFSCSLFIVIWRTCFFYAYVLLLFSYSQKIDYNEINWSK